MSTDQILQISLSKRFRVGQQKMYGIALLADLNQVITKLEYN